ADDVGTLISAFRAIAIAASRATVFVVAGRVRRVRPEREAFAVALVGLNPVVLFQSAASGHNDLLVALGVAAALALVFSGRAARWTAGRRPPSPSGRSSRCPPPCRSSCGGSPSRPGGRGANAPGPLHHTS